MRSLIVVCSSLLAIAFSSVAFSEDAQGILRKMQELERARWEGVNNYVVDQATMGQRILLYHEKIQVPTADGGTVPAFRLVPPDEVALRQREDKGFPKLTPEDLRRFSQAAESTGDALGDETERSMAEAGLPPGLMSAASPNRYASLDPRVMMGNVSGFTSAAADAQADAESRDPTAAAREMQDAMADFARAARLTGTETISGRQAFVLRADGINRTHTAEDGGTFTIRTATFWLDTAEYVPLKVRMEGVATSGNEQREVVIEKEDQDYRKVGSLYLPYRQVMRIAGVMDAEQEQRMREAQQQMAQMEQQMAQMSESQRQMAESMMGPQLEMMRKLASGGGFEVVTDVYEVRVNAGLPDQLAVSSVPFQPPTPTPGGPAPGPANPASFGPAASSPAPYPVAAAPAQEDLRLAQQRCLQEKVEAAQKAQKKKRGLGRLMSAVARTAARHGNSDLARTVSDVYDANATAEDLAAAARDLGLTEDEVAACQNPQ